MNRTGCAVATALIWGCGGGADGGRDTDLLVAGGAVYTLDWPAPDGEAGRPPPASSWTEAHGWRPSANAVAIDDGRMVWVGSGDDAAVWRQRAVRVVDVAGAAILPDLVDPVATLEPAGIVSQLAQRTTNGYTGVHVVRATPERLTVLEGGEAEGRVPIRVGVAIPAADSAGAAAWAALGPDTTGMLRVGAVWIGDDARDDAVAALVAAGFRPIQPEPGPGPGPEGAVRPRFELVGALLPARVVHERSGR